MADVGGLDRDRSAVAAAAQTDGDSDGDAEPEDSRATIEHVRHLRRRRRLVADEPAQPEHDATADKGDEVHAVGDLEPLQIAEPAHPPGPPELLDDARHAADRGRILAGRGRRGGATVLLAAGDRRRCWRDHPRRAPARRTSFRTPCRRRRRGAVDRLPRRRHVHGSAACTSPRSPTSCRASCAGSSASPCIRSP